MTEEEEPVIEVNQSTQSTRSHTMSIMPVDHSLSNGWKILGRLHVCLINRSERERERPLDIKVINPQRKKYLGRENKHTVKCQFNNEHVWHMQARAYCLPHQCAFSLAEEQI